MPVISCPFIGNLADPLLLNLFSIYAPFEIFNLFLKYVEKCENQTEQEVSEGSVKLLELHENSKIRKIFKFDFNYFFPD